jgi:blue copper oxidase
MKRRDFIKRSSLSALTAWAGSSFLLNACHTEEDMIGEPNWIVEGTFDRPLPIPTVVQHATSLNANVNTGDLLKGRTSQIFGYGNSLLGPTMKATTGETMDVTLQNSLSEETNIHWHGLILPENMDGHPKDVAAPGGSLQYTLPIIQRAGTYWYHPHSHGTTAHQVFMGLAGMFIVNDQEEAALNLPTGEYEIPLIIQDKHFEGGNLAYSPSGEEIMTGYLGEHIIVNGLHAPFLNVVSGWYRLRILNGSTARVYNLGISGGIQLNIIGSDGGLLSAPEHVSNILLGPGERLDVLVDFSQLPVGKEVYLVSNTFSKYNLQGRQSFKLMKFSVNGASSNQFTLPASLSNVAQISPGSASKTRTFDISAMVGMGGGGGGMGRHSINGKTFEMERVDETVQAGSTEIWEFDNTRGDEIHPMHIHGVQFQVIERIGGRNRIIASERAWKDTVLVMPGEKVRVVMTFPEHTGVFVFHCHNLEHEDDGMMLNYQII